MHSRTEEEIIVDLLLFVLLTVPFIVFIFVDWYCSSFAIHESTCSVIDFLSLLSGFDDTVLVLGYSGLAVIIPIGALVAVIFSLRAKIRRYANGYKLQGIPATVIELLTIVQIIAVTYSLGYIIVEFFSETASLYL